jgi:ribonuclease E
MASQEEPRIDDTRGLPGAPAPQSIAADQEDAGPEAAAGEIPETAAAAAQRNGEAAAVAEPSADGPVVSPARPRGVASFPGGPPPVVSPMPDLPSPPLAEAPPLEGARRFRVATVETAAATRPAGPPPAAPRSAPAPLAPEPPAEAEEEPTAEAEVETGVDPQSQLEVEASEVAEDTAATTEAEAAQAAEVVEAPEAPPAETAEAPAEPAPPDLTAAPAATAEPAAAPEPAVAPEPAAPAEAPEPAVSDLTSAPEVAAPSPEVAAVERAVAEPAAPGETSPPSEASAVAAPDETSADAEPTAAPARPATRRRRRGRTARAGEATQAPAETEAAAPAAGAPAEATQAPAETEAAAPAAGAPAEATEAETEAQPAPADEALPAGTLPSDDEAGDAATRFPGTGSARTRARRRRRAAAKVRQRGPEETPQPATTAEEAAPSAAPAAAGQEEAPAAAAGETQPEAAPAAPAKPSGRRRGRGAAAATAAATAPAEKAEAPTAEEKVAAEQAPPTRSRGRRRRLSGTRVPADDAARTSTSEPATGRAASSSERSTRLEASRARVRQGDRGRRRRSRGLTEDQKRFLREGLDRRMLVTEGTERTQIAVLEGRTLVEHYVTRKSGRSLVGNIYLGRVQNVLPGMEAAFVDIGRGRNAVLYAGEVNYSEEDLDGEAPRIEKALKPGQSILVQVTKDPIGAKGARLTTQVSLAGRYLVLQPEDTTFGISRRLPESERVRLREILKEVRPKGLGLIVRTAAEGAGADDLRADLARLQARWEAIERKGKKASAPAVIYQEPELVVRVIRDIFSPDFTELVVDAPSLYERVKTYLEEVAPDLLPKMRQHDGRLSLFEQYRVSEQIHKALERKVWLPSGGSLVIDQTEAMTVIDVNTGKYVGKSNLEETVVATNLEAAEEIVRQLRLRDIGGIIIIDFIDMLFERNQQAVVDRLRAALAKDKTKSQVMEVSSLGLVQMTRKRVSGGLLDSFSETCPACEGRGVVITHEI